MKTITREGKERELLVLTLHPGSVCQSSFPIDTSYIFLKSKLILPLPVVINMCWLAIC